MTGREVLASVFERGASRSGEGLVDEFFVVVVCALLFFVLFWVCSTEGVPLVKKKKRADKSETVPHGAPTFSPSARLCVCVCVCVCVW